MWRSTCPESVRRRIEAVDQDKDVVVSPMKDSATFLVKRKRVPSHTVVLGAAAHTCSCGRAQPCVHALAVLVKVLNVSTTSPTLWQPGIGDLELQELLQAHRISHGPFISQGMCYLCREGVVHGTGRVCSQCKTDYHHQCAALKAAATKGLSTHSCPRCGAAAAVRESTASSDLSCTWCRRHIARTPAEDVYRCVLCPDVILCRQCYASPTAHVGHPVMRATGVSAPAEPASTSYEELQHALQHRDVAPEDYELLLTLDQGGQTTREATLSAEQYERLPRRHYTCGVASSTPDHCAVCLQAFTDRERLVVFSCGHQFHEVCGRRWTTEYKASCPVDQQTLR